MVSRESMTPIAFECELGAGNSMLDCLHIRCTARSATCSLRIKLPTLRA